MRYHVVRCYFCGIPFYVKDSQKSKRCTNCNKNLDVSKLSVLFSTDDVEKALLKVIELKKPKSEKGFVSAYDTCFDNEY
jgi:hypothetical protein